MKVLDEPAAVFRMKPLRRNWSAVAPPIVAPKRLPASLFVPLSMAAPLYHSLAVPLLWPPTAVMRTDSLKLKVSPGKNSTGPDDRARLIVLKTALLNPLLLLQWHYFFLLEWSPLIVDIREQFPLDLDETCAIAADLGLRHPTDPRTREPVVMTTDFVNTVRRPVGTIEQARTLKYAKELGNPRVMEKFEIERVYWAAREVDWGIVTEVDIDSTVVENIKWVHPFRDISALAPLTDDLISSVAAVLTPRALAENLPLRDLTAMCDGQLGLADGASLAVVRHLLATRRWQVDIRAPIRVPEKITLIAMPEASTATAVAKKKDSQDEFTNRVGHVDRVAGVF
ncbi:MAG: TnsA endonuclease N-terminal domain-containing protein [Blastocatellia bacterium]